MTGKPKILSVGLLTIAGLVGSSLPVRADDRDERHEKCEKDIHKAEDKLHDAIERHGEYGRQAEKRRHELDEVKRRCDWHDHDHDHDQH
jgi:hypothetical protein